MRTRSVSAVPRAAALVGLVAAGLSLVPLATTAEGAPPASRSAVAAVAAAVPPPPAIAWGRCQEKFLRQADAECGLMTVPLDYANPAAATIQIAVSRILATRKPYRGAVFTNPGGPGGSGLSLSVLGQYVPKKVGLTYDWYGVDPRGVGDSVPALSCDSGYTGYDRAPYVPRTQAILDFWLAKTAGYAAACAAAPAKALLTHLHTTDVVNDFESLRLAIAQPQVTFYGFSYGTYIGQVYASLYPGSLKAMVLDGVVDASRVWYNANTDQDYAFEKAFTRFFAWLARYDSVYHLGTTKAKVRKTYARAQRKLERKPLLHGKIGPSELDDALIGAGYYNGSWTTIGRALSDLVKKKNARGVKRLFTSGAGSGPEADNGYAVYLATQCSDAPWPTDFAVWQSDQGAVYQQAPLLTWANAWFNMPCRTWGAPSASPVTVNGSFTGPVLLLGETRDAATPFSGAKATRALFPSSALVEGKNGTSHAVSLSGVSCTDNTIAKLLKKGKLPHRESGDKADKRCPPLGPPNPTLTDADRVSARVLAALAPRPALPLR